MHTLLHPNRKRKKKPIIAVTMGDAAGVGPELCLYLLSKAKLSGNAAPLVIGDAEVLARVARQVRLPFSVPRLDSIPDTLDGPAVYDLPGALAGDAVEPGKNQAICGRAAERYIRVAVQGCMEKRFVAMVTAPISKKALNLAGIDFPGHTEMLAHLTRTPRVAMLLYSDEIACAFATCHQSLRSVPESLDARTIAEVAELAWANVSAIRGAPPRLALLGLNPHAGEEGLFGDEEKRILLPAKAMIEARGIEIEGPLPADTAFTPQALKRIGCHIAMYHDQGSIPFKMMSFDVGVNVTMGLPIIRTSPDHGTAFDIAWKGKVSPDSMLSACDLAVRLSAQASSVTRKLAKA
jgi:4-hydroxythreonine-4-phosphate dehydrogenase